MTLGGGVNLSRQISLSASVSDCASLEVFESENAQAELLSAPQNVLSLRARHSALLHFSLNTARNSLSQLVNQFFRNCQDTYLFKSEKFVNGFKFVGDIVTVASNLLAVSFWVEVVRDFQVIARGRDALDLAHAQLGSAILESILCLASETSQLNWCQQHHRWTLYAVVRLHKAIHGIGLVKASEHHFNIFCLLSV